ncbi:MAG TPA: tRNA (guanosine(37)-N1)-methyltransferase TrmD [Candidatus Manganitrophaceae bacterium]|nr:tRNA (guanosine(37)-N1)-methyltransferase TrmD [Candidatus Manganitrophaceae bacterium]
MKCDVITLFPGMVAPALQQSILKRAQERGLLEVRVHQLRDFTTDKHHVTDDAPYGGGPGMVLKAGPICAALEKIRGERGETRIILTSPQGAVFNQKMAHSFSREDRSLVFICGHYEGIDERVKQGVALEEVSVGDYILTGGELAALLMIDASARLVPGVLGKPASIEEESFSSSFLEYPHYTRPADWRGMKVPEILVSGNHEAVRAWRREQALLNTLQKRPDLIADPSLTEQKGNKIA